MSDRPMKTSAFTSLAVAALAVLTGCATPYPVPEVSVAPGADTRPLPVPQQIASNGSIYQASQYRPLFEDHRARLVGDVVNVQIVEKVSASQKSTSSINKTGSVEAGVTALPLLK